MTDREILDEYRNNYFKHMLTGNPVEWKKCEKDTTQALTQLQAYYREKIKRVGIAKILWNAEFADGEVNKKEQCKNLANAILKEIDKELNNVDNDQ